jgi:predicted nucleic acid-binding protein
MVPRRDSRTLTMEFVDTNILLYAYDATAGERHEAASALVDRLWRERSGAISVQVLQEFYVNVTRKVVKTIDPRVAVDRLKSLARWRVHSPLSDDVIAAATLSSRHQLSFWDAMIVRSAAELRCDTLWTADLNEGQIIEGVQLTNPFTRG